MRLYTIWTDSHLAFLQNWFLPSIQDDYTLEVKHSHISGPGYYFDEGWRLAIQFKIETIVEAIKENLGEWFVWSDVDIQFFGKTRPALEQFESIDLVCQRDNAGDILNSGFMFCKASDKTLELWEAIAGVCQSEYKYHDQTALNLLVRDSNHFEIQFDYLPDSFFSPGPIQGKGKWHWKPGDEIKLPADPIVLHHATWTEGIKNKIKQLELVKDLVGGWRR